MCIRDRCTDLGKPAFEGYATEVGMVYEEIGHALRYLKKWARPKRVRAPLTQFPSSCRLYEEPKGIAPVSYTHLDVYKRQVSAASNIVGV